MTLPAIRPGRTTGTFLGLLALPLGLALLAGCSGGAPVGGSDSTGAKPETGQQADRGTSDGDESVAGGVPDSVPPEAGGGTGADELPEIAPADATLAEQIVRSGDVTVDVDDITSAANRITALVAAAGGSIGSEQRYGDPADGSADIVVRVPPDSFGGLLEAISELGEEQSRSIAALDVSTVVADVDARVASLQGSVDRLRSLAAQAISVSDLITIESELTARQSELESLQAQQRALADQVSLATLSVRLTASGDPEVGESGFLASLGDGWNALLGAGRGLLSIVGLLLPWLVVVALIAVPVLLVVGRRRPRAVAPAPAASPGPITEPAGSGPGPQPG